MPQELAEKMVRSVVESLHQRREALGWSQRALATKAGLDPKTVNLIERGVRSPTLFTLSLLACAMEVSLAETMKNAEREGRRL